MMFALAYIKKCCGSGTGNGPTNVIVSGLDVETAAGVAVEVDGSGPAVQVAGSVCVGYEAEIVAEVADNGIISN